MRPENLRSMSNSHGQVLGQSSKLHLFEYRSQVLSIPL